MDNYPVGPESLRNGLSEFLNENIEATGLRRAILQELCYLANPTSSAGLTPPDGANSRFAAWPSVGYLAWRVGSSKSVVTKILKGLAGDGLIEIRQGGNPDRSGQRGRPDQLPDPESSLSSTAVSPLSLGAIRASSRPPGSSRPASARA